MKLSNYCKNNFNLSNRIFKRLLKEKKILLNNRSITKNIEIKPSDIVELDIKTPDLSYQIEDYLIKKTENIIFLYKPPYMHSERHSPEDKLTIEDIALKEFPDTKMITRLDYETDGVIALIKKNYKINSINKTYLALVKGTFSEKITINNKIDASKRKKVMVLEDKSNNTTIIEPFEKLANYSIVKITLENATRHQIRAYLAYLNFSIIGDNVYGYNENCRLMLHCLRNTINNEKCNSGKQAEFIKTAQKIIESFS
jgi:23S rRNA pseudouridine1911/1915/1917 synthase